MVLLAQLILQMILQVIQRDVRQMKILQQNFYLWYDERLQPLTYDWSIDWMIDCLLIGVLSNERGKESHDMLLLLDVPRSWIMHADFDIHQQFDEDYDNNNNNNKNSARSYAQSDVNERHECLKNTVVENNVNSWLTFGITSDSTSRALYRLAFTDLK